MDKMKLYTAVGTVCGPKSVKVNGTIKELGEKERIVWSFLDFDVKDELLLRPSYLKQIAYWGISGREDEHGLDAILSRLEQRELILSGVGDDIPTAHFDLLTKLAIKPLPTPGLFARWMHRKFMKDGMSREQYGVYQKGWLEVRDNWKLFRPICSHSKLTIAELDCFIRTNKIYLEPEGGHRDTSDQLTQLHALNVDNAKNSDFKVGLVATLLFLYNAQYIRFEPY